MADERKAILLRISPPVWAALNRWAQDDLRSLNGQIEYLLRDSLRRSGRGVQGSKAGLEVATPEQEGGEPEHRE